MLFPVRLMLSCERAGRHDVLGWILLGPRPDGSLYGGEEERALTEAAGPIAIALSAARAREAREAAWGLGLRGWRTR